VAEKVVTKFVKSPAGLATGKGTPKKTKAGMRAAAEPNPPKAKRKERQKETALISQTCMSLTSQKGLQVFYQGKE
jgi:hypothetical protein